MTEKEQALKEFKRLFWEGRELAFSKKKTDEARQLFAKAETLAKKNSFAAEAKIARASILELDKKYSPAKSMLQQVIQDSSISLPALAWHVKGSIEQDEKNYDAAIESYRNALDSPGYDTPGDAWLNMGAAYAGKNDYDQAIQCSQKALDSPGYDTPGYAWNNMGIAYTRKNDYDQAIQCSQKALDSPGFDTPGMAWFNMGYAYSEKKDYDQAIKFYQKALDSPGYDTPGDAWNNMGAAYLYKKDFNQAIQCYQKALDSPGYDTPGYAWFGMGVALESIGKREEAINAWEEAAEKLKVAGESSWASIAESKARSARQPEELRSKIQESILKEIGPAITDKEKEEEPSIEARILQKIENAQEDCYQSYEKKQPASGLEYVLATLRGWSSATPLVGDATLEGIRGGGYFLKWKGKGMVIDPGFDFIRNFHEEKFSAEEIDLVIVTHHHTDHHFDLKALEDLRYELGRRKPDATQREQWKHHLLLDEDTYEGMYRAGDGSGYQVYFLQKFDLNRKRWNPRECIDFRRLTPKSLPFCVHYFHTQHTKEVPNSVGIKIECFQNPDDEKPALVVGYSSDTEFFPELCHPDHLGGCDILIANISEPDPEEMNNPKHAKKHHLGYRGMERLVKGAKPGITILGECWPGIADLRIWLTQGLRKLCETERIIPASLGLQLNPNDRKDIKLRCTNCKNYLSFDEVVVTSPSRPFDRLGFLCKRCRA